MADPTAVSDREDIEEELWRLSELPLGRARSIAVEELVRRIEADGPAEVLAQGYATLVRSYVWGGEVEKAFVPFTRWLRLFDVRPELFRVEDRDAMFWSFRWMVSRCMDYPQIPFEQIEETIADMERRYALAGLAMDAVRLDQFRWAWLQGSPETERLYWEWVHTSRTRDGTCTLCDAAGEAHYLSETGRTAEAVDRLNRAEDDPRCDSEPAGIQSQLAEYLLTLDRPVDAVRAYRKCVQLMPSSTINTDTLGRLALFLARGGQPERAVRRIETDQRFLLGADTPGDRMYFLMHVAAAARIVALSHPELPVRLDHVPVSTVAGLADWSREQALELVTAFDRRNGGHQLASELARELALELAPRPLDLAVLGTSASVAVADDEAAVRASEPREAPEDNGHDLARRADRHVQRGELLDAVPLYLAAVTALRSAGELVDAGLAEANAARCAHELEDVPGADAAYRHAIGVLRAAGAPALTTSAVARSWVPLALEAGTIDDALDVLVALRTEILGALEDGPDPKVTRAMRTELAESLDTHARALASQRETDAAVRFAVESAELFASVARTTGAAHSCWLAGRTLVAEGRDEEAIDHLESAVEGFGIARRRSLRGKAASDLVDALRRLGRDADADDAALQLEP